MVTVIVAVALRRNLGDRTAGTSLSSRRRHRVQSSEFLPVVCGHFHERVVRLGVRRIGQDKVDGIVLHFLDEVAEISALELVSMR